MDNEEIEENVVARESVEDSSDEAAPAAAPFRLGPVPSLNPITVPTGVTDPTYPRGKFGSTVGGHWDSVCEQVVSIIVDQPFFQFFHLRKSLKKNFPAK